MAYAITHTELGTFIGEMMGMAFWSVLDAAGQTRAAVFNSEEEAMDFVNDMVDASARLEAEGVGETLDDGLVEIHEVASGHWRDLEAAGLHIGDMRINQIATHPHAALVH